MQKATANLKRLLWPLTQTTILALLIVNFVFTTVGISGESMLPSLHDGERAFVPRYETWLQSAGLRAYERGDIVFFRTPEGVYTKTVHIPLLGIDIPQFVIKRIVATEGDRIRMEAGIVYLNGLALDSNHHWQGSSHFTEITVPKGHVFVLGDNRTPLASVDSRHFGPIPVASIAGRASAVIWPILRHDEGWHWNVRRLL